MIAEQGVAETATFERLLGSGVDLWDDDAWFDLAAKHRGIPLGTGNKTERLFGYFTWHADDSPPINPLGDLFKTQVWALAKHLGVPHVIVDKPPTADLVVGQTDEGDFGISYAKADEILNWLLHGYAPGRMVMNR